jgi:hypothetical protein
MGARVFRKIENNVQRGRLNGQGWILAYDNPQGVRADPLTGWSGGGETQGQVTLSFPSLDAAVSYAEREKIDYDVIPEPRRTLKIRSYSENLK